MKLRLMVEQAKDFVKVSGCKNRRLLDLLAYRSNGQYVEVGADSLLPSELDILLDQLKKDKRSTSRGLVIKINMYRKLAADPGGAKITKLEALAAALKRYLQPSPHKWLFTDEQDDGQTVPWYVSSISYAPPNTLRGKPAVTSVELESIMREGGHNETLSFGLRDLLGGKTVVEILHANGYYLETPEAVKEYLAEIELYKDVSPRTGEQFSALGPGFSLERYAGRGLMEMVRDGAPARVVMDDRDFGDDDDRRERNREISDAFWKRKDDDEDDADETEGEAVVPVPVQPYVKVFDLSKHQFVRIHVKHLMPYKWDETLSDKLVLSQEIKDLIAILIQGADLQMEDIIRGKTGGIIVIATGPPGVGKTLSAEVFSESVKKPLYIVHCSQLGTDEETVEKKLRNVLDRAIRWKAILLIDEADVYVHERGCDINQNAIVGVFLRVLEYYRGILFMTSNRSTIIDDAILSRATAWIRYEKPGPKYLPEIWRVLAAQYKVDVTTEQIANLVGAFPDLAGRDVKNLLRLGRLWAASKQLAFDEDVVRHVSQFISMADAADRVGTSVDTSK